MKLPPLPARLRPSPGTARALLAGLLAAATGVAVAEVVGGVVTSAGSPVVAVGGETIDRAPPAMTRFGIETFGTNDKVALIVGTLVLLAVLGAALGPLSRRRPRLAAAVVVAVSALGVLATRDQESIGVALAVWPSLLGAAAAVAVMVLLRPPPLDAPATAPGNAAPGSPLGDEGAADGSALAAAPAPAPDGPTLEPRRQFLIKAGLTVVMAAVAGTVGRVLQGRGSAAADRAELALPTPVEESPRPTAAMAPDPDGVSPFYTSNADFYRIDTALTIPQLTTDSYRLRVTGMVDQELDLSWEDITRRDLREYDITLSCVSNLIGGDLVDNARWLGFPLRDLLDEAGVQDGADQVVGRSADDYTAGFPLEAVYDRDAIVAIGMNGEPLPLEHGYPVRLVTPGLYGYVSATKWLVEVELTTFEDFEAYWVPRGYAQKAPIKTMSRVDTPRNLATVDAGPLVVGGVAWAQTKGIERVEVRLDDGDWQEADLSEALNDDTWRQWTLPVEVTDTGFHTVLVRATDGTGETQPEERTEPLPDGATGWHQVRFQVR